MVGWLGGGVVEWLGWVGVGCFGLGWFGLVRSFVSSFFRSLVLSFVL